MTVATPTNSPITVHLRTGKWDRIGARAACRAMRDEVLRKLTGIDDPSRSIERSRFGKPFLPGVPDLNWSATSCAGFTAIAVCHGASVGLDAECVRPDLVDKTLIERCLAPEESDFAEVIAFDPDRFFDVWVRKEAALKQLGYGLHLEPHRGRPAPHELERLPRRWSPRQLCQVSRVDRWRPSGCCFDSATRGRPAPAGSERLC